MLLCYLQLDLCRRVVRCGGGGGGRSWQWGGRLTSAQSGLCLSGREDLEMDFRWSLRKLWPKPQILSASSRYLGTLQAKPRHEYDDMVLAMLG